MLPARSPKAGRAFRFMRQTDECLLPLSRSSPRPAAYKPEFLWFNQQIGQIFMLIKKGGVRGGQIRNSSRKQWHFVYWQASGFGAPMVSNFLGGFMLDSNSSFTRMLAALPLILALTLLNGCASIFTGTTDQVTFDSNVPGVRVTIDGEYKGETPLTLTLSRNFMNGPALKTKFEKEGYQTQEFQLKHEFNTVAVLDITSIPTSGGIDLLTGALMKFSPNEYHVQMLKKGQKPGSAEIERSTRLYRYALANYRNVQMDISRGGGEYLDSLASALSGTQGEANAAIVQQALRDAPVLVGTSNAHDFVRRLNEMLASQPELRAYQI